MQHTLTKPIATTASRWAQSIPIPKSWWQAAGLLRHKRKAMERHLQTVRREWSKSGAAV